MEQFIHYIGLAYFQQPIRAMQFNAAKLQKQSRFKSCFKAAFFEAASKSSAAQHSAAQRRLLRLQRYTYSLVWIPGSRIILADALSRSYTATDAAGRIVATEFPEELAVLMDKEQQDELRMVESQRTIDTLCAAAVDDDVYQLSDIIGLADITR